MLRSCSVRTVVRADGAALERILDTTYPARHQGLSRLAFGRYDAALRRTAWALGHEERLALVEDGDVLASAQRRDLTATLDEREMRVCGIGSVFADRANGDAGYARELVDRLLDDAKAAYDLAILAVTPAQRSLFSHGFDVIPTLDLEIRVEESSRRGAPMTLVRGGEDRDLAAIVAMGRARATPFRFHLNRDEHLVKYAITAKRLLAGLGADGVRQLRFVIAEEGITAAAYAVISILDGTWTIEECGDRDPTGARVGAILQALIAREPAERRPVIRAWLAPGFAPPQVTVVSSRPSEDVLMLKVLNSTIDPPRLSAADVLYWRSDIF